MVNSKAKWSDLWSLFWLSEDFQEMFQDSFVKLVQSSLLYQTIDSLIEAN